MTGAGFAPTREELSLTGAVVFTLVWELAIWLGPLNGWPGGTTLGYTLVPAIVIAIALGYAARNTDALRPAVVLTLVGFQAVALLVIHHRLGPVDTEIAHLYSRYGRELLDTGRLPVAEYPPLALAFLGLARWLGDPPITVPLLSLPLLLGGLYAITRLGRHGVWAVAAVALWPTVLAYWEIRFDAIAVACICGALLAAKNERWFWAGLAIGVGTFFKWYPALVFIPFAGSLLVRRDVRSLAWLTGAATAVGLVTMAPLVLSGQLDALFNPYRFQSGRPVTADSIYYVLAGPTGLARSGEFPWDPAIYASSWDWPVRLIQLGGLAAVAVTAYRRPGRILVLGALAPVVGLALNRIYSEQFHLVVVICLGAAVTVVSSTPRRRVVLASLFGLLSVANYAVFPGASADWLVLRVTYWTILTAVVVLVIRTALGSPPGQQVPDRPSDPAASPAAAAG